MKSVLSKVQLGEVDAGVVYVTDVAAGDKVTGIEIPADVNASTTLPDRRADQERRTRPRPQAFVDYVLSPDGASVLTAAGFQQP